MQSDYFKKKKLPDKPGVYFFIKNGEILYIGKATSLRDRVKSYFSLDLIETRGPLLVDMVFKADKIKYQTTDSVLEALILEANLIKKYQPKYNTKEKSDKSFNYVCITNPHLRHGVNGEGLPKVIIMRGKNVQHRVFNKVFGPYVNSSQLKEALKIIRKIFPFLDDKSKNYLEFYKQINLAPDLEDRKLYLRNIKNIILFFEGKKKKILKNLEKGMHIYAKAREFEKAGEIKRQIFALKHINDVALLKSDRYASRSFSQVLGKNPQTIRKTSTGYTPRIEAYDIAHMGGKNMVGVMVVLNDGEIEKSEYKKFRIKTQTNANDTGALEEVLERRLAHTEWTYPNLIVVDGNTAQINVVKKVFKKLELNIPVVSAVKDEHHKVRAIIGDEKIIEKHRREILLANSESHRFAIAYHKKMRNKNFLK